MCFYHIIYLIGNNSNVLQNSTTTTTDPQQPAKDSKVDPLEIKFDTVNDTPLTEKVVEALFVWLEKSALLTTNGIVKTAIPLALAVLRPIVATELNKIDGNPAE